MDVREAYEILNLEYNEASPQEIKDRFRTRAFDTHPDRGGDAAAFSALRAAHAVALAHANTQSCKLCDGSGKEAIHTGWTVYRIKCTGCKGNGFRWTPA